MPKRPVRRSQDFIEEAQQLFPPGGSASGRPSFQLFEQGPLRGAETAFSLNFEAQLEPVEGVGSLRSVVVPPTAVFGPLVISAILTTDGVVEIVGVIEDDGYWDLVEGDQAD
jgi:hypothetical protein